MRSQTQLEIEQWQTAAEQYWDEIKQHTEAECTSLKQDADTYAAEVLQRIEQQLSDMMRVVRNGRTALPAGRSESPIRTSEATPTTKPKGSASPSADLPGRQNLGATLPSGLKLFCEPQSSILSHITGSMRSRFMMRLPKRFSNPLC